MKLGEVLSFETGYPFSSDAFNEEGNGVRLIKNRDLKADDRVVFYGGEYDAQYIVQNGDILIGMDGDFSPCLWKKGKALLNQRVGRVNVNRNTSRVFILYVLIDSLKKIELKTSSTTVKHLSHKDVEKIKASLPSFPEQRKIAALLSLIDERIEVQNAIIKEREAQKAALLRRLFDRTLRFPEFTDEWKKVKLGEVTCERNETKVPTLPLLSITADKGIIPQTDSEKKDVSNADKSKYKRICAGDIGYNTMRMWQGRSALSFVEGIVSPAYTIVTPLEGLLPLFLSYLIKRPRLIYEFWTHSQGLVEDTLNCKYKDLSKIAIALPSLAEQRKIAALLSAIDERIAVETEYAALLQKQKAYLLRQMFV